MKLTIIAWDVYGVALAAAAADIPEFSVTIFSPKAIDDGNIKREQVLNALQQADGIFLYRTTESCWEWLLPELKTRMGKKPLICTASNPLWCADSTVPPAVVAAAQQYLIYGGRENSRNLLRFIAAQADPPSAAAIPVPQPLAWQGIYHPDAAAMFAQMADYLAWYPHRRRPLVGIVFGRSYWLNENCEMIDALVRAVESRGLGVVPVFCQSLRDEQLGCKSNSEVIAAYFLDSAGARIEALIKLSPAFAAGRSAGEAAAPDSAGQIRELFGQLNVPVFQPIIHSYKTESEWEQDAHGTGSLTAWYVTMPEFEGVIEPLQLAVSSAAAAGNTRRIVPIVERAAVIAERVSRWVALRRKPVAERRIAFVLHNNPCASVEATVGGAANLDSIESVSRILRAMRQAGYEVEAPADGAALIQNIMARKAVSEFRWTGAAEIVAKGGALTVLPAGEYQQWFDRLPEQLRCRMIEAWGKPPGEEKDGVSPAMVYDGGLIISGVRYGNAVVCVQPKRGCAGSRCDGRVCRILHDPDVPPPHQYFATYWYLERTLGVDAVVHVGTHGNLEFLPGKGVGLSGGCCPDAAIGVVPHLYIYNADNPPEGAIAKRRSYATLVSHMQAVMRRGGLSADLEELEQTLGQYRSAQGGNKSRVHALEHIIRARVVALNLAAQIEYSDEMDGDTLVSRCHEALSLIANSQINDGLHVFGEIPGGGRLVDYIRAIIGADVGALNLRRLIFALLAIDLEYCLKHPGEHCATLDMSYGQVATVVDELSAAVIRALLEEQRLPRDTLPELLGARQRGRVAAAEFDRCAAVVRDIARRIADCREIEALLSGFNAGHVPAGPSGKITRGRYDVLPSGRNFYTLDIFQLPTKAAYIVGEQLSRAVIDKHMREEGRLPEQVAIYWTCMDITCCDGEGMAQIMALLGARPVWSAAGQVTGFEIIPLAELRRPRIDVLIRVGGINRDIFPECVGYIDDVIRQIAALDEPAEQNFVRKHSVLQLQQSAPDSADAWQDVTTRIFGSKPGTYMAGVNLAVHASSWKTEKDLSDIFVYWNQYAYGKQVFGRPQAREFISSLRTVDVTFNKAYTDEYDLFGCCAHFATQGGMTAAARALSGKAVKAYYGDTRDAQNVGVRDVADEVRRIVRSKLLNPDWIAGMQRHGYKGLGDIAKKIDHVYGWEATTGAVDDWIFDDITKTYVLDEPMRQFFAAHNPWALEEISRRLLEAQQRGLWHADPQVLDGLRQAYVELEGLLEEQMPDGSATQAGEITVVTTDEVAGWRQRLQQVRELIDA